MSSRRSDDRRKKPATSSAEAVGKRLSSLAGFADGVARRERIIQLGALLKRLREEEVEVTQSEAAAAIGINQSELSRIESGHGERGPSYQTITNIIETYSNIMRERGAQVLLTLEIKSDHHRKRYQLSAFDDDLQMSES